MIYSMTAFARAEQAGEHGTLSWEIRSVNHRYLEPHLRLPESFRDLEGAIREALRKGLSRGKIECTLRFAEDAAGRSMQVDHQRAGQLIAAAESVAAMIKQPAPLNPLGPQKKLPPKRLLLRSPPKRPPLRSPPKRPQTTKKSR